MSTEPAIIIRLDSDARVYLPGQSLSGEYWIESVAADQLKAVELSILWSTEGKGDEDMAVHEFQRRDIDEGEQVDPSELRRFATVLPNSPLSYEGRIIRIQWCVRVRAFLHRGKEVIGQKMFQLGDVLAVRSGVHLN
jgi:hypothetical protein